VRGLLDRKPGKQPVPGSSSRALSDSPDEMGPVWDRPRRPRPGARCCPAGHSWRSGGLCPWIAMRPPDLLHRIDCTGLTSTDGAT
jgi:hypothetical protein